MARWESLKSTKPVLDMLDRHTPVFHLAPSPMGGRIQAGALTSNLGDEFSPLTGRMSIAQDRAKTGAELPALITACRCTISTMPARYTERQAADRGAVARYYQENQPSIS